MAFKYFYSLYSNPNNMFSFTVKFYIQYFYPTYANDPVIVTLGGFSALYNISPIIAYKIDVFPDPTSPIIPTIFPFLISILILYKTYFFSFSF